MFNNLNGTNVSIASQTTKCFLKNIIFPQESFICARNSLSLWSETFTI